MEEKKKFVWIVDLPNPFDIDGPWIQVAQFDTDTEATQFVQNKFGGGEYGDINPITVMEDE